MARTTRRARRIRGQSGITLLEVLLTVGVLAIVMIPLLAWTVMAMQRANDTGTAADTTAFTQVSQFLSRDVAAATIVDSWRPAENVGDPAETPTDPCGSDPTDTYDYAAGSTWLFLRDADGNNVVYVTDDGGEGGSHRLLRRECGLDGVQDGAPTVLADGLQELTAPDGVTQVAAAVACEPREGLDEDCGAVAMTLQARKADPVTLRAVRRVDDVNAKRLLPTSIIRCLPSCVGTRDADKSFTAVLDGSRSSSPDGDPLVEWSFPDNPDFPPESDLRTDELTFVCTSDLEVWNEQLEGGGGCEYRVGLRITDQQTGQAAQSWITVIVLNAKPTVHVARNPVSTHRVEPVQFDASQTVDADDPDGEELEFEWYFDDPALAGDDSNTATGAVATHTYHEETDEGADRTATLTVTDNEGYETVVEIPVRVRNNPPVAVINSSVDLVDEIPLVQEVVWDAADSHDPDGKVTPTGREAEYDLDRAPKRQGPDGEDLSRYEWVLLDADGEIVQLDEHDNQVVLPPGADPEDYPNVRGASWDGPVATLTPPGLMVAGVYTINLTVYDVDDPSISTTASRVIDVNEQPRSVIDETKSEPQAHPETGVITITPDMPDGARTVKLDGGLPDGSSGSFDPDEDGNIRSYRWEFWTQGGDEPEAECSAAQAPPCYIDGGSDPEVEFGPGAANVAHRIPHGRYRVQLRVTDNNNVPNECFWHDPWDEPANCVDDRPGLLREANPWVEVFINRVPSFSGVTFSSTPNPKSGEVYRRTDVNLSPVGTVTDVDGSIASFEWSFERLTPPTTLPIAMSSATGLLSPNATVHFHEPELDYQVRATLRVTDDIGAYRERSITFTVRNKPPRAGITVLNLQTGERFGNPNVPWATSADPANDDSVVFQLDAGPARDDDGLNGTQAPFRSWRIYKKAVGGGQHQLLARFGEYNLSSTCTIHEETLPGWEPEFLGQECFNFKFHPLEHGTYIVTQEVWDDLGERNEGWAETEFHVHHPPEVEVNTDFNGTPSTSCVPGGISTSCTLGFTTDANDDANGGQIVEYTYDWGDGSPVTVRPNGNRITHNFNSALTNPDGSCRTNTGICGQWDVTVTVRNNTYGVASTVVRVRVNSRPVAVLIDPATGQPAEGTVRIRVNCPPLPDTPDVGDCEVPSYDASASYDPDGSIVEYWWYQGVYNATDPTQNRLGITEDPTPDPYSIQIGYSLSAGHELRLVVVDNDGVRSNPLAFRLNSNRAPRNVNITQPSGAQPVSVQRNVPTNWRGTSAEDGGDRLTFTWRFERVSDGSPIEFLDPDGNLVTSYTAPAVNTSGTTTQSPLSALAFPAAVQGRAILEVTDDLGLSASNHVEFRFNVVDAAPVAVITPVPEADNPIVFTDVGDDVPEQAYSVTFDGSDSYDPDANGDGGPGPVTTYQWTVTRAAGGTVCSGSTAQFTCDLPDEFGTFRVRLQVADAGGRTHFTTWDVRVNRPPTAVVAPETVVETGAPLTVDFSAAGSQDGRPGFDDAPGSGSNPGGGVVSYTWSWGDGSPDTVVAHPDQSASHTYTEPGTYVVTLTVTDTDGATDTATATVKVNEAPQAAIEVSRGAEECTTLDGPRGCVLNAPGPYTITLDGGGSSDVDGSIFGYAWTIEGPGYSEVEELGSDVSFDVTLPDTAGTYEIHLTVTDDNGAEGTATAYVTINDPPVAVIGGDDPLELQRGAEFHFDGSGSIDPDGVIETYTWEFRDEAGDPIGTPLSTASPVLAHAIDQLVPAPGEIGVGTVRLTVTDAEGGTGSADRSFIVGNQLPVPVVTTDPDPAVISPGNPDGRATVTLDGSDSYDPDDPGAPLVSYEWTVTDLATDATSTASGATVELGPGTSPALPVGRYEVTLTVTDGDGDEATSTAIEVVVNASPVAVAEVSPTVVNPGDPGVITFDGSGSSDADGSVADYHWQVDGPSGYSESFGGVTPDDLTLIQPGDYTVTLTVTDDLGGVDVDVVTVRFNAAPQAHVLLRDGDDSCDLGEGDECVVNDPFEFVLDGLGSSDDQAVVGHEWQVLDVDDELVASGTDPTLGVNLPGVGTYTVSLRVRDGDGVWSEVVTGVVRANESPTAAIGGDAVLELHRGLPFTFDASGSSDPDGAGVETYSWEFLDEEGGTLATAGPLTDPLHDQTFGQLVPATGASGEGTVRLTVVDVDGASSVTVSKPFVVRNQLPVAQIVQTPAASVGAPGYTVLFESDSHDPDGSLVLHEWVVCQGTDPETETCEDPVPVDVLNGNQFTFPDYGSYTVRLTVGDHDGAVAEAEAPIKINRPPVAGIEGCCELTVAAGAPLVLNGGEGFSEDVDGEIVLYLWQFSGPEPVEPGFEPSIVRTFDTPGEYEVTLEVVDDDGELSEPITATIEVTP